MRAGLYQQKNGLPVFFGSLRPSQSMTWAEISSSTVLDRSSVSGPSLATFWFASVPSAEVHDRTGRGGIKLIVVLKSTERSPDADRSRRESPGSSERLE